MRKLEWNEEFYITFNLDGHRFSTPLGRGYSCLFFAEDEKKRLLFKGATRVSIKIRKWN